MASFRVHGFGPYREVLDGLDCVADEQDLRPDQAITEWIAMQAGSLHRGPFLEPIP